jgi:hypothetical protein
MADAISQESVGQYIRAVTLAANQSYTMSCKDRIGRPFSKGALLIAIVNFNTGVVDRSGGQPLLTLSEASGTMVKSVEVTTLPDNTTIKMIKLEIKDCPVVSRDVNSGNLMDPKVESVKDKSCVVQNSVTCEEPTSATTK